MTGSILGFAAGVTIMVTFFAFCACGGGLMLAKGSKVIAAPLLVHQFITILLLVFMYNSADDNGKPIFIKLFSL